MTTVLHTRVGASGDQDGNAQLHRRIWNACCEQGVSEFKWLGIYLRVISLSASVLSDRHLGQ